MLYSVMPPEEIWQGLSQKPAPTREMVVGGVLLQLEPLGDFQARVVRVISSNPNDYLLPHTQPGFIVRWT
ncbi:MAG TPA: hypothetical protein GX528_01790 [Firmicutes bacterium]|nr:hypothetical protein [Bacillota bacterium]